MGCCGCDNRTSANTAGIFAIIQCIVGFSLAIYNLKIFGGYCGNFSYFSSKAYICGVLFSYQTTIRALLIVAIVLYIIWLISSVILLVGNAQNKAGFVRQWVGISTVVIICDIIFPSVIAGVTYGAIIDQINAYSYDSYSGIRKTSLTYNSYTDNASLAWNYIGLIITFSRGGLITWCCDIALTVYVSRRATEITNPPTTGYVYTQAFPTTTVVTTNQYPYAQQGFVPVQQGYVVQPQPQQFYQPTQFNQPGQFNQAQGPTFGSQNPGPPPSYSTQDTTKY